MGLGRRARARMLPQSGAARGAVEPKTHALPDGALLAVNLKEAGELVAGMATRKWREAPCARMRARAAATRRRLDLSAHVRGGLCISGPVAPRVCPSALLSGGPLLVARPPPAQAPQSEAMLARAGWPPQSRPLEGGVWAARGPPAKAATGASAARRRLSLGADARSGRRPCQAGDRRAHGDDHTIGSFATHTHQWRRCRFTRPAFRDAHRRAVGGRQLVGPHPGVLGALRAARARARRAARPFRLGWHSSRHSIVLCRAT